MGRLAGFQRPITGSAPAPFRRERSVCDLIGGVGGPLRFQLLNFRDYRGIVAFRSLGCGGLCLATGFAAVCCFFWAAQRARWAAAIRSRPALLIVRRFVGFATFDSFAL